MRFLIAKAFRCMTAIGWIGVAVGCGENDLSHRPPRGGAGGAGGGSGGGPPAVCHAGARWSEGTQAFADATGAWGLDTIGAEGVRLSAVDFDGDGWTDLVVRRGGSAADDYAPGGKRQVWLLRNNGKHGFEDVTVASGIGRNRAETDPNKGRPAEVFAFGDVDNDGDLDVFTGILRDAKTPQVETSEVLLNQGDGTFALGPEASAVRRPAPALDAVAGASFVDVDRDGVLDLWVAEATANDVPQQDRLYRGDCTGSFADITLERGLATKPWSKTSDLNEGLAHTIGWGALACDLNGDGNAELLVSSYGRSPDHLWLAGGAPSSFTYTNRSVASGYAFDENQDWTDNESARCWCKLHPTDGGCEGVPPPAYIPCATDQDAFRWDNSTDQEPFRLGGNSATTVCADVDNDGDMDLVTSEIVHWDVGQSSDPAELLVNTGEADVHFTRPGNDATGLARHHDGPGWDEGIMTAAVFDFDDDGWPDVYYGASDYPGNHGLLFHQDAPGHFIGVPIDLGIDQHRSHGIAVADFDHDGDLDVVVGHSLARCDLPGPDACYPTAGIRLFENQMAAQANWIALALRGGEGTNRAAIGARVSLTAGGVTQTQEVGGGHGHYGIQHDLTLSFGLGAACEADVTIRWPDAALTEQSFHLPAGYRFVVTQGSDPEVAE